MRTLGNADGIGSADVCILRLERPIAIEDLDAFVAPVAYIHIALRIDSDGVQYIELPGLHTLGPQDLIKRPFLSNFATRAFP